MRRSRHDLERVGHAPFMGAPARVRAERAQHRRELAEMRERARAGHLVARDAEVDVEEVFPRPARNRPRLELRQIDAAQREDAQRLEQRARLVRQREDDRRLVGDVPERRASDDEEAGDVVVEILNRRGERDEAEHVARARGRDRGGVFQAGVGDHLRAARGVVRRDDLDVLQRPQEALARREPLRVRVDAAQAAERCARQRQQVMHDRQLDLRDDRQLVREQQVVVAVDAAADRVLERQDAVRGAAAVDGVEDVFEAVARDQLRLVIDPPRRRLAKGARLSLIRDLHSFQLSAFSSQPYTKKAITRWMMALVCNVSWTTSSLLAPGANDDGKDDSKHRDGVIRHFGGPSSQINNLYWIITSSVALVPMPPVPYCDTTGTSMKLCCPEA